MSAVKHVVGPAVAEWVEDAPLRWTMSETLGKGKRAELKEYLFDLRPLLQGYKSEFLLALKDYLIDRRLQVRLVTISIEAYQIRSVLQRCQREFKRVSIESGIAPPVFERVDSDFLTGLWAVQQNLSPSSLAGFKCFYAKQHHNSALFQKSLYPSQFPTGIAGDSLRLGALGRIRQNILTSALSQAALVQILNITEAAYETGELSLSVFAYSRLLLSRAARPESFRLLLLKDLQVDEIDGKKAYFLTITIPKARTATRPRATIRLHQDVGLILDRQRDAVARSLGGFIEKKNAELSEDVRKFPPYTIGDLPLFPAGGSSGRMTQRTKDRLGMVATGRHIACCYTAPLKKLTGARITHLAMRHTMGTQLAIAGCSASTIAAVLLHASSHTASAYVDLLFSGAIDELSDSLEPAFLEHFPVITQFVSVNHPINQDQRIVSSSLDRGRRETTGECGRPQICQYAPIACYECHRFKPCYDVDHTINLDRVIEELNAATGGGLPRQADIKRYLHIANRIRVVISICDAKREAITTGRSRAEIAE